MRLRLALPAVRISYFGVRGSCPCSSESQRRYGGNTSCVLVEIEGEPPLILDMGTGLRALGHHLTTSLAATGLPLRATALLTHLHYDHVLGTPFFPPMRDPGALVEVYGPAQEGTTLQATMAGMVRPPFFPVDIVDFRGELVYHDLAPGSELHLGSVTVVARQVNHVGTTFGFRIEAGGAVVAYIPDHQAPLDRTEVEDEVLALCDGADLLLHDAQYTDEEFAELADWGHSTPAYAVRVAAEAGVRRLDLFHHDPGHTDEQLDEMLTAARRVSEMIGGPEVHSAHEGGTVEIDGRNRTDRR